MKLPLTLAEIDATTRVGMLLNGVLFDSFSEAEKLRYRAITVAGAIHWGHKYGGTSYLNGHLLPVVEEASTLAVALGLPDAVTYIPALALCHDTIEDGSQVHGHPAVCKALHAIGGDRLVLDVSTLSRQANTPYEEYIAHVAKANEQCQVVKLADALCNMRQCLREGNLGRVVKYAGVIQLLSVSIPAMQAGKEVKT